MLLDLEAVSARRSGPMYLRGWMSAVPYRGWKRASGVVMMARPFLPPPGLPSPSRSLCYVSEPQGRRLPCSEGVLEVVSHRETSGYRWVHWSTRRDSGTLPSPLPPHTP